MFDKMLNFWHWLKTHAYLYVVVFAILVGIFLGGYFFGQAMVPTKTTDSEKTVITKHETDKTVETDKDTKKVDSQENKHIHTEVVETTHADGTKEVKKTTDIGVEKTVKEVEIRYVDRVNTVVKEVEKRVEVVKTVETVRPNWTATLRLGTSTDLKPSLTAPYFDPLLVGVEVDRRIIGPFKAGLWVTSSTKFNTVSGGVAVSVEF